MIAPQIIDDKSGEIKVRFHMGKIKLHFDEDKWTPYFGVADSGSTINISFKPRNSGGTEA